MIVLAALAAAVLIYWAWSRSPRLRAGGWRVGAGLGSTVLVVVGAVLAIRGDWLIGLPLVIAGLLAAFGGRVYRGGRATPKPPPEAMSAAEARALLGVGPEASREEIRAAYKRLMLKLHPDKGGTQGLAEKLNAARDRLLKQR